MITPPKDQVCSKRSWDGQIRKWRRYLHKYSDNIENFELEENEETHSQICLDIPLESTVDGNANPQEEDLSENYTKKTLKEAPKKKKDERVIQKPIKEVSIPDIYKQIQLMEQSKDKIYVPLCFV